MRPTANFFIEGIRRSGTVGEIGELVQEHGGFGVAKDREVKRVRTAAKQRLLELRMIAKYQGQ